ncbi:TPA: 50S ribosomal protein L37ae [Candidatus Woesearchaeota archaeon]|nr:MAG: 50S ribosomal protein L37Ae, large subunit ribosomal protein L37Ae [archaeon GW2011_AR11]MBS3110617.1 50S ribosomal protein L37ae [Candidatus Woesearchaeota archaeon]HIH05238.1 50S ribosomal protein L37ae [Candidatus Woesearchaeota archaeon]HIH91664.1 50S ribosomal protein L37ae [Candidatus Woesearchaeota archaeon]HII64715.1 50S ribosomal protein L37ae [Candidatus Woesearchaeota archaeon]
MKEEKLTSVKRFGTRYGRTTKLKFGQIEAEQRKKHKCPYCAAVQVKRIAAGIWNCTKCRAKFAGRAYTIARKQEAPQESPQEQLKETVEEPEEQEDFQEEEQEA